MKKLILIFACSFAVLFSSFALATGPFLNSLAEAKAVVSTTPAKHVLVYYGNYRT